MPVTEAKPQAAVTTRLTADASPLDRSPRSDDQPIVSTDRATSVRLERRSFDRWPIRGKVRIVRLDAKHYGQRADARLVDHSTLGLGLVNARPLPPGAWVAVEFDGLGMPDRRGVVVGCRPSGDGHRVAIRFERRKAA